jgi:hypothetical protein
LKKFPVYDMKYTYNYLFPAALDEENRKCCYLYVLPCGLEKARGGSLPLGEGSLYAAQTVCVSFRSSPGEGAASWETAVKITKKLAAKTREGTQRKNGHQFDRRGLIHQTPCVNRPGRA